MRSFTYSSSDVLLLTSVLLFRLNLILPHEIARSVSATIASLIPPGRKLLAVLLTPSTQCLYPSVGGSTCCKLYLTQQERMMNVHQIESLSHASRSLFKHGENGGSGIQGVSLPSIVTAAYQTTLHAFAAFENCISPSSGLLLTSR